MAMPCVLDRIQTPPQLLAIWISTWLMVCGQRRWFGFMVVFPTHCWFWCTLWVKPRMLMSKFFFPFVIFQWYFIFIPLEGVRWYLSPTIFVLVLLTTSATCRPHCSLDLKLCHRSGILCSGLWCKVHYPQWLVCQVTHQWFQWVSDSSKTTVWQWHR